MQHEQPARHKNAPSFGWSASLAGGLFAVGGGAFFGTLSNVLVWRRLVAQGLSSDQAYAALTKEYYLFFACLSIISMGVSVFVGGYLAARYGGGRPVVQGAVAGLTELIFVISMFLTPASQPTPSWFVAASLLIPIVVGAAGGALYGRKKA